MRDGVAIQTSNYDWDNVSFKIETHSSTNWGILTKDNRDKAGAHKNMFSWNLSPRFSNS